MCMALLSRTVRRICRCRKPSCGQQRSFPPSSIFSGVPSGLGIGYRPYEAQAVRCRPSVVAYGLENLPDDHRQASNEDLQRSFDAELRLLVEWIRTFGAHKVRCAECVSCNWLHPHVGPLWRDFCTRIAAELGVEPSYGRPIAELASETRTALAPKKLRNRRAPFVGSLSRALGGWLRRFGRRRVP